MTVLQLKPYTNNVIFFDTEFSSNDLKTGELLSIGLIKISGEELYLEIENQGEVSEWVRVNILPTLKGSKLSLGEVKTKIVKFLGSDNPYLISYRIPYDTVYLHKLFGLDVLNNKKLPFSPWPLDMTTILFMLGLDPRSLSKENIPKLASDLRIDLSKYVLHNALDDAKLLRDVYLKLIYNV